MSSPCLHNCIDRVLKQGIEQIEIDVCLDDRNFFLPWFSFSCRRVYYYPAGFQSVHILSLTNVYFKERMDLFSGENFPLLRKLCLKHCDGMTNLYIKCPGLEFLELDCLRLKGLHISGTRLLELRISKCFHYGNSWAKILAPKSADVILG